jgi:hypothetical protein
LPEAQAKSRTAYSCSPEFRQEWRGKLAMYQLQSLRLALRKSFTLLQKFHRKPSGHGRHAYAALHNLHDSPILPDVEDQSGA